MKTTEPTEPKPFSLPTNFKNKEFRALMKGKVIKKIGLNRPTKSNPSSMLEIPIQGIKIIFTDGTTLFIDAWLGEFSQDPKVSKNKRMGAFLTGALYENPNC